MKKENILVAVLLTIAVFGIGYYINTGSQEVVSQFEGAEFDGKGIDWKDYSDGMALAQEQGKPIFLYFHAEW